MGSGFILKKDYHVILQMAAVFIGTIVGAGLASGQEITQFFSTYGYMSFMGIVICCFIYIIFGKIIISLSIKYNLKSYSDLIFLVNPSFVGKAIDIIMGLFLVSSAAIILAGSGALLHEFFRLSPFIGIFIMASISLYVLLMDTKGLIEINSFIVPSLSIVIITIFILYLLFNDNVNLLYIKNIPAIKKAWLPSSFIYGGFNIFCCSGVLIPLSLEIKNKKSLFLGLTLGSIGLTILSLIINLLLILNIPYIFKYEIPLLYISNRFGKFIQSLLLLIIWLEMFSTEVSDIYSVCKSLTESINLSYKKSVFLVIAIALPVSQIGFVNLISILYPAFGILSLIFMLQCVYFYYKSNK